MTQAHDQLPPRDEIDSLLRAWHDQNAARAAQRRDALMARIAAERLSVDPAPARRLRFRAVCFSPLTRVAASLLILVVLAALLLPSPRGTATACPVLLAPEAGRLDAFDPQGHLLGPCALKHTDVNAEISGPFARVTVKQRYHNAFDRKIEAVYTFPLSHRAAVDRMTMTIGDRVIVGEVKEREQARQTYQAARDAGYVASLLEQERPNIFTQSVANIEPGAEVAIEISYIELVPVADGQYSFDFPIVVSPRYIPGSSPISQAALPVALKLRAGVVLLAPATVEVAANDDLKDRRAIDGPAMRRLLESAAPIEAPDEQTFQGQSPQLWHQFAATYPDDTSEQGLLLINGFGHVNGRWFFVSPAHLQALNSGTGYEPNTNQVPDASRITPMPVRPPTRAGHDISLTVSIDTGGPGLLDVASTLHAVDQAKLAVRDDGLPSRMVIALKDQKEIPNREFVLSWRQTDDAIQEAVFTHASEKGRFFTLMLQPPARQQLKPEMLRPRELVFIMDTSGSMSGFPIEKSKQVISRAIDAMRSGDSFNIITFSGDTAILWDRPRPATPENRALAQSFVASRAGGGGTEMMKAIDAALVQPPQENAQALSPAQLADLPADGREVLVQAPLRSMEVMLQEGMAPAVFDLRLAADLAIRVEAASWMLHHGSIDDPRDQPERIISLRGRWLTRDGRRVFAVSEASDQPLANPGPMRIVMFLTDGQVGNDMAIIDAVKKNAATTRVFSFGIGNSPNRYLLDGAAKAGRGEAEYVTLADSADEAVSRFVRRLENPVLTDISVAVQGAELTECLPPLEAIADLWDQRPLIIHGQYAAPGNAKLTIRGVAGTARWEKTIDLDLPEKQEAHDAIATLWARTKVQQVMDQNLAAAQQGTMPAEAWREIVSLGERFSIMTQYTSFVAVEKSRVTIDGKAMLVTIPIELPAGTDWRGFFGDQIGRMLLRQAEADRHIRQMEMESRGGPNSDRERREVMINESLQRVRQLQAEMKYDEALQVIDTILFLEEKNPTALALKDVLQQTRPLQSYPRLRRDSLVHGRATNGAMAYGLVERIELPWQRGTPREKPLLGDIPLVGNDFAAAPRFDNAPQLNLDEALHPTSRFGWKAQAESVLTFGMDANLKELGLCNQFVPAESRSTQGFTPIDVVQSTYAKDGLGLVNQLAEFPLGSFAGLSGEGAESSDSYAGLPLYLNNLPAVTGDGAVAFEPTITPIVLRSPLPPEEAVLFMNWLIWQGKPDESHHLAEIAMARWPEHDLVQAASAAMVNSELNDQQRHQALAELAAEAIRRIESAIQTLRIIDARLLPFMQDSASSLQDGSAKPASPGVTLTEGGAQLSILLRDLEEPTLKAITDLGAEIKARSTVGPLIIAIVPLGRIDDLAMLETVRRIEPTQ